MEGLVPVGTQRCAEATGIPSLPKQLTVIEEVAPPVLSRMKQGCRGVAAHCGICGAFPGIVGIAVISP
jgi:hypothetical protein